MTGVQTCALRSHTANKHENREACLPDWNRKCKCNTNQQELEPTCSTVFFSLAWEVVALSAVSFFIDVVVLVFESDSSVLLVMPVIIPSDFWAEEEFFFFFTCVVSFLGMEETTVFLEGADVAGIIIAAVAVGFGADVWFVVCPLSGVDTGEVISNGSSEEKSPPSRSPSIGFERTRSPFCSRQRILEVRFSFVNFTYR